MIKAIIFDMDGVLVAAKDWHYDALNRALAFFNFEIPRDKHLTQYDGLTTAKKLDLLSKEEGLPKEYHTLIQEKKQAYTIDIIHEKCVPFDVHQHALSTLKSQGYKLALASNSIRNSVDLIMEKTQLRSYLDEVISASEVSHPKPHPEIYNTAIAKLGFLPHECLVIEDNMNGIKSAQAAGAHLLVVEQIDEVNLANITSRIKNIELMETRYEACEA